MQEHSRPACYRRGRPQRRAALRAAPPTPVSASTSSTARDRRPQARASSAPTAASIAAAKAATHEHALELKHELVHAPHEPRRAGASACCGLAAPRPPRAPRAALSWTLEWRRRWRSDDARGLGRAGDARGLGRPRCCHRGGGGGAGGGGGGGEQQGKGRSTSVSESLSAA